MTHPSIRYLLLLVLLFGCEPQATQQDNEPTAVTVALEPAKDAAPPTSEPDVDAAANPDAAPAPIESTAAAEEPPVPPDPVVPSRRRVVLMMRGSPLLVDFLFLQDGQAYDDVATDAAIVQLMDADEDFDGMSAGKKSQARPYSTTNKTKWRCLEMHGSGAYCFARTMPTATGGSIQTSCWTSSIVATQVQTG